MAVIKRVLCRERLRRVPEQFSWLGGRGVSIMPESNSRHYAGRRTMPGGEPRG